MKKEKKEEIIYILMNKGEVYEEKKSKLYSDGK